MREGKPLKPEINVRHAPVVRKGRAKYSERVARRVEIGETLCASIEVNKDTASAGFSERLAAELREGEAIPEGAQAFELELVARSVKSALMFLEHAELKYFRLGIARVGERRESERIARQELNPRMVLLRRTIDAHYGKAESGLIHGLVGKTLRKPGRVLRQARDLLDTLRIEQRDRVLAANRPIASSERESWLRQVAPAYRRLAAMMKEVRRLERAEEFARATRDLALERFDDIYGEAFAYTLSVYRLAGFTEQVIGALRPVVEQRRLVREAVQEQKARAEGRRLLVFKPIRTAVQVVSRWLKRWPRRVA